MTMNSPIRLISTDFDGTLYSEFGFPHVPKALQEMIGNLQAEEGALRAIEARASTISDILLIQPQLVQVRTEIEQLKGQQSRLTNAVALSSIRVQLAEPGAYKLRLQLRGKLEGSVRIFSRVVAHQGRADLVHRDLLLPLADEFTDFDILVAEKFVSHVVQTMRACARVEQVMSDHRIAGDTGELDTVRIQNDSIELDVVVALPNIRVLEDRLQCHDHRRALRQGG